MNTLVQARMDTLERWARVLGILALFLFLGIAIHGAWRGTSFGVWLLRIVIRACRRRAQVSQRGPPLPPDAQVQGGCWLRRAPG